MINVAFINCDFLSQTLGMAMNMKVILPNENDSKPLNEKKVLYLLHGRSDDSSAWSRYSSIERYAREADMAVVMPTAHKSFYTNMVSGDRFYDFIAFETPAAAQKLFGLSSLKENNYIAGLSMGGYGAFKIGMTNPDKFAGIASLSGVMDIEYFLKNFNEKEAIDIFGGTKANETNCLFKILENQLKSGVSVPPLYQCCGTEDFLYESNIKFRDFAKEQEIKYTYWETPGTHEWGFWDANIKKIIDLFNK